MAQWRCEEGTVTAFVTVTTVAMLMAAGLVLDGGALIAARREAIDQATAAARAGAQAVSAESLRHRGREIDHGAAADAADAYLRRAGYGGTVEVDGDRVRVAVSIRRSMTLLRLVGIEARVVSGSGEARLVRGVSRGET